MMKRDHWGWRARFGLFIVASEAVPEAEWWAMMPPGTSVHVARIDAAAPWASWKDPRRQDVALADDLARGAGHFASMRLDSVIIGHSSSSILGGPGWDQAVVRALGKVLPAGTSVTTNGLDCLAALQAADIHQPFLVFPPWFNETLVDAGLRYFASHGFSPAGSMRVDPGRQWRDLSPSDLYAQGLGFEQDVESLYRQIRAANAPQADGVMIVGTGLRCVGVIDALERDLDRPVITANQASLWRCLRLGGVRDAITGYGRLLEGNAPAH